VTLAARLFVLFAVAGAPLAWIGQLLLGYVLEESACSAGDGEEVWGLGVHAWHVIVGTAALAVAVTALAAAAALRAGATAGDLDPPDRGFLASWGLVAAALFAFTIVLTGVGSTVLDSCRGG